MARCPVTAASSSGTTRSQLRPLCQAPCTSRNVAMVEWFLLVPRYPSVTGNIVIHPARTWQYGTFRCPGSQEVTMQDPCEAREVLGIVGDKWALLIVRMLKDGPRRFTEPQTGRRREAAADPAVHRPTAMLDWPDEALRHTDAVAHC